MANEFVVKNGLKVSGNTDIQGTLTATSYGGTIDNAISASHALTSSYVNPLSQTVIVNELAVGTSTPYSNASFSALTLGGGGKFGILVLRDTANDKGYWYGTTGAVRMDMVGTNSYLLYAASGLGKVWLDGTTGNFGLGNQSPQGRIHISGSNSDTILLASSNTYSNIMSISGSGKVGIRMTPTGSSILQINGDITANSFTGSLQGTAATASYVNTLNQSLITTGSIISNTSTNAKLVITEDSGGYPMIVGLNPNDALYKPLTISGSELYFLNDSINTPLVVSGSKVLVGIASSALPQIFQVQGDIWVSGNITGTLVGNKRQIGLVANYATAGTTGTVNQTLTPIGYSGTITGWYVTCYPAATISVDIWKANNAVPTIANSIVASAPITTTAAQKNNSTTLTGWTTSVSAGDLIMMSVTTNNLASYINVQLIVSV